MTPKIGNDEEVLQRAKNYFRDRPLVSCLHGRACGAAWPWAFVGRAWLKQPLHRWQVRPSIGVTLWPATFATQHLKHYFRPTGSVAVRLVHDLQLHEGGPISKSATTIRSKAASGGGLKRTTPAIGLGPLSHRMLRR